MAGLRLRSADKLHSNQELADEEDGVQLLAEALTYTNRGLNRPYARGDELEQGARVDASGLGEHVCKHPSGTYMIKSA